MATEKESVIVSSAFMFIRCTRALIRKYQKKMAVALARPRLSKKMALMCSLIVDFQ